MLSKTVAKKPLHTLTHQNIPLFNPLSHYNSSIFHSLFKPLPKAPTHSFLSPIINSLLILPTQLLFLLSYAREISTLDPKATYKTAFPCSLCLSNHFAPMQAYCGVLVESLVAMARPGKEAPRTKPWNANCGMLNLEADSRVH
ncbi:hypothetical protein SLA2020_431270 [Shorea laevis]